MNQDRMHNGKGIQGALMGGNAEPTNLPERLGGWEFYKDCRCGLRRGDKRQNSKYTGESSLAFF